MGHMVYSMQNSIACTCYWLMACRLHAVYENTHNAVKIGGKQTYWTIHFGNSELVKLMLSLVV